MKTLTELARELRTNTGDFGATMDEAADRIEAIDKAWRAYEALPLIDKGPMRYGCWPALDRVSDAIEGTD